MLDKADALIRNNKVRITGKASLRAADPTRKGIVATIFHKSKKAEMEWLVTKIVDLHKKGFEWRDFLVLFPEGKIAEDYVTSLQNASIPLDVKLRIAGPFDSTCFAQLSATCRFMIDQTDNMAVRLCLEYWPNLGAETVRQLRLLSVDQNQFLWQAVEAVAKDPEAHRSIVRRRSVAEFHAAMAKLRSIAGFNKIIPAILTNLPDCGSDLGVKMFGEYLSQQAGKESAMNLQEALGNFEMEREAGRFDVVEEELPDKVRVMTMHSAKGLEAKVVFIPALEDDSMPGEMGNEEERRRLFFVSITRAKEMLIMSWASQRTGQEIHRAGGRMLGKKRSRFLKEMGE